MGRRDERAGRTGYANPNLTGDGAGGAGEDRPTSQRPRSIYLDAVRSLALARVVVYHALAREWLQIFAALPLMFFVAGSLYAASLERRRTRTVVSDRYRRILVPYWCYIIPAVGLWAWLGLLGEISPLDWFGIAFPALSAGGPQGPGLHTDVEFTWIALWYLQFHLVLAAVGGPLRRAQQRRPRVLWGVLATIFVLSWLAGSGVVIVVFYLSCWVLGYHHHDGDLRSVAERWWRPMCLVGVPVGAGLFLAFEPSILTSGIAVRLAAMGAAIIGVCWLVAALGLQSAVEPLLTGRRKLSVIHWMSQRAQTIYMWHMMAIYVVLAVPMPGGDNWAAMLAWTTVGTVVACVVVGWAEDVAARRRPSLWPRLPPPAGVGRSAAPR